MKNKVTFISNMSTTLNAFLAVAALTFWFPHLAVAQDGPVRGQSAADSVSAGMTERYPAGSIRSVEIADQALADVQQGRSRAEEKFAEDERRCFPKFFVTSCMDAAKEELRRALAQIQEVEVEANAFKRRAKVEERDKALAEKISKPAPIIAPPKESKESNAAAEKSEAISAKPADRSDEPKRTGQAAGTMDRAAQHNEKMEQLKEKEAAEAQKRAENVAAFEEKARKAEERQRKVAARKAEKDRKRAEKNPPARLPD